MALLRRLSTPLNLAQRTTCLHTSGTRPTVIGSSYSKSSPNQRSWPDGLSTGKACERTKTWPDGAALGARWTNACECSSWINPSSSTPLAISTNMPLSERGSIYWLTLASHALTTVLVSGIAHAIYLCPTTGIIPTTTPDPRIITGAATPVAAFGSPVMIQWHSACAAVSLDIVHPTALPAQLIVLNAQLLSRAKTDASLPSLGRSSACGTTSEAIATTTVHTEITPALSVGTLIMAQPTAPEIELRSVLLHTPSPYKPDGWKEALESCNITSLFPNLVQDIVYGSPIGNPPPITHTFITDNLPSIALNPSFIIVAEVHAGRMSGPFTISQSHVIFGGHLRTSPLGLVPKLSKDANTFPTIRHLSKKDAFGFSTNDWQFPTK